MEKKIYIVRHCEAQGQSKEANLTEKGFDQAIYVANFFQILNWIELLQVRFYELFSQLNH